MKALRKFSSIYGFAVSAVTILVIIATVVLMAPKLWGWNPYVVLSGSMEPAIHTGAVAYIDVKDKQVEDGDIFAFEIDSGKMVTHRAVRRDESGNIVTKGDANDTEDMVTVSEAQIIGKYRYQLPYVGYIAKNFKKREMILSIASIIVLNVTSLMFNAAAEEDEAEDGNNSRKQTADGIYGNADHDKEESDTKGDQK